MRTRIALALVLALLVGGALYALAREPDPDEIADALPVLPEAKLFGRFRHGSTVHITYTIPRGTGDQEVQRFYRARMDRSWHRPDTGCEGFTRDGALVIAAIDSFDRTALAVIVAADGADACDQYESILAS